MEEEMMNLFRAFDAHIDTGMVIDIRVFLGDNPEIVSYDLKANQENIICIFLKLKNIGLSKKVFYDFMDFVGWDALNMFITHYIENGIEYLFFTSNGSLNTKMKIIME